MSSNKKTVHIKRKSPTLEPSKTIYSFESFDAFCDFCAFVETTPFKEEISNLANSSDLYEYNSNYYLILTNLNLQSEIVRFICPAITEFAHFVDNSELFEKKITEYGKSIIKENAIETCIRHFSLK